MTKREALERGNWVPNSGFTMETYSREASNGKKQMVIRAPSRESWGLFVEGYEMFRDKSLFLVLREANLMGAE